MPKNCISNYDEFSNIGPTRRTLTWGIKVNSFGDIIVCLSADNIHVLCYFSIYRYHCWCGCSYVYHHRICSCHGRFGVGRETKSQTYVINAKYLHYEIVNTLHDPNN